MARGQSPLISTGRSSAFSESGVKERIWYAFYDRKDIANGATAQQVFFQSVATDDLVSNFEGQGSMPAGQGFKVHRLRIVPKPGTTAQDVQAILANCRLLFTIENAKRYAMGPAWLFPGGAGTVVENLTGLAAPAAPPTGVPIGHNGIPSLNNCYALKLPVSLRPQQQFNVSILPQSPVLGATVSLYVVMEGFLERNLQ